MGADSHSPCVLHYVSQKMTQRFHPWLGFFFVFVFSQCPLKNSSCVLCLTPAIAFPLGEIEKEEKGNNKRHLLGGKTGVDTAETEIEKKGD